MNKPLPRKGLPKREEDPAARERRAWLMSGAFRDAVVDHFSAARRAAIADLHGAGLPTHGADEDGAVHETPPPTRG